MSQLAVGHIMGLGCLSDVCHLVLVADRFCLRLRLFVPQCVCVETPVTKGSQQPVWSVSHVRSTSQQQADQGSESTPQTAAGIFQSHQRTVCVQVLDATVYRPKLGISVSRFSVSRFLHVKTQGAQGQLDGLGQRRPIQLCRENVPAF